MLDLLREGLTNEQIAERLGVTIHAARYHVSEILSKLGVSSREEAARWQPERRRRWSVAVPLPAAKAAGVAVVAAALVGLGVLAWGVLSEGRGEDVRAGLWKPGQVIHIVMVNDGVSMVGAPLVSEQWTLVGEGDITELTRVFMTDADGNPGPVDAFYSAVDQMFYTFFDGELHASERPENQSVFMWTQSSVEETLLSKGYVLDSSTNVAGFAANVYVGEPETGSDRVRSVYISTHPYGLDLGEELIRLERDGSEVIVLSRKLLRFEVVELAEAPEDVFDWPY